MFHTNKAFLSLAIFMLFLHPAAHAESDVQFQENNQLKAQVQQLQTQVKDANARIALLEVGKESSSPNINTPQNSEDLRLSTQIQSNSTMDPRRTANGHGR